MIKKSGVELDYLNVFVSEECDFVAELTFCITQKFMQMLMTLKQLKMKTNITKMQ